MTKIFQHKGFLTILIIGIFSILAYFSYVLIGFSESKNIFLALLSCMVIGFSIYAILSGIKKARSVYDKVLTALIGNIILNVIFIIALYFVVTTLVK